MQPVTATSFSLIVVGFFLSCTLSSVAGSEISESQASALARLKSTGSKVHEKYGPHGRTVFAGRDFTDREAPLLELFTDIEALDLSRSGVTDKALESVKTLRKLRVLSLPASITDDGIAQLRGMAITSLGLPAEATDASMAVVATMKSTKSLGLSPNITDEGLETVCDLSELIILDLGKSKVTNGGLAALRRVTGLSMLYLREAPNITTDGLVHIQTLTKLGYLDGPADFGDRTLTLMRPFRNLNILNLKDNARVTDSGLKNIDSFERMNTLELGPNITDVSMEHVGKLKHLYVLDLEATQVTGEGLKHLTPTRSPSELRLSGRIGDKGLAPIVGFQRLSYLVLSDGFTAEALQHLPQRLTNLELRRTGITKEDILELRKSRPRLFVKLIDRSGGKHYFD